MVCKWQCVMFILMLASEFAAAELNDPTKPLGSSATVASGVSAHENTASVSSVFISSDRKVAIINGQALKEGDVVKGLGAIVKVIDSNGVVLLQNGKAWRVLVNNTAVRK